MYFPFVSFFYMYFSFSKLLLYMYFSFQFHLLNFICILIFTHFFQIRLLIMWITFFLPIHLLNFIQREYIYIYKVSSYFYLFSNFKKRLFIAQIKTTKWPFQKAFLISKILWDKITWFLGQYKTTKCGWMKGRLCIAQITWFFLWDKIWNSPYYNISN
jgi:hypothetical protein